MLINIFTILILLAVSLVVLGFVLKDKWEYLAIAGSILLVLLGIFLINDPLEMVSGEYYVYGNNFTDYHWDGYDGASVAPSQVDREAFLFHTVTEYEPISDSLNFILWFIIMSSGLFLFLVKVINLRSDKKKREQKELEDIEY